MIDALFGSRTRVKLLHLFYSNPGKSFYVREITRLIDEQINSVRRELSNMLEVGVITSTTADNKLFYAVSQRYEYYAPLRQIFADATTSHRTRSSATKPVDQPTWLAALQAIASLQVVVAAGKLVEGSASHIDLLLVGDKSARLAKVVEQIEGQEGSELSYSVITYEDLYYRLSVHDKFVMDLLLNRHEVLFDRNQVLKNYDK